MPKSFLKYDNQVQCLKLAIAVIKEGCKAVLRPPARTVKTSDVWELRNALGVLLPICRNITRNPTELKPRYCRSNEGLVACRSRLIKIFESVNVFWLVFRESEQPERWSKA